MSFGLSATRFTSRGLIFLGLLPNAGAAAAKIKNSANVFTMFHHNEFEPLS
jgi:hypothetical protein